MLIVFLQLKEEQSVHGSDEEAEDDAPDEQDTDFSDDDDNKQDHEEVKVFSNGFVDFDAYIKKSVVVIS